MDFKEAKEALSLLLKTSVGSVPLAPDFGLDWDAIIDLPTETAKAVLAAEIVEKQNEYIPEIIITSIEFETSSDGKIEPKIIFELSDEYSDEETDEETDSEEEEDENDE